MAKLNNIEGMMSIMKLADCRKGIIEQPRDIKSCFKN